MRACGGRDAMFTLAFRRKRTPIGGSEGSVRLLA